jgi:hypothetical protein
MVELASAFDAILRELARLASPPMIGTRLAVGRLQRPNLRQPGGHVLVISKKSEFDALRTVDPYLDDDHHIKAAATC